MRHVFQARYDGWCSECGDQIEPGDEVTYNSDNVLVHDGCNDEPDDDGRDYDPFD